MKFKLTENDAQEVMHKIGILDDEPELQEGYGLTQAQATELFKSIPHKGGEWEVPEWAIKAVCGEMENHAEILRNIAANAFNDREVGQSLRINKQAKKFENMFTLTPTK